MSFLSTWQASGVYYKGFEQIRKSVTFVNISPNLILTKFATMDHSL